MQNKSVLKTSAPGDYQLNEIDQSQCGSLLSEQVDGLHKTKSQFLIHNGLYSLVWPRKSADNCETRIHKPLPIRRVPKGFRLLRKIRKSKKNQSDYRKNICGYITKKVMREFVSSSYYERVKNLCQIYNCEYSQAKNFYSARVQRVTGPSHLPELLVPISVFEIGVKKVFACFFNWFLKQRYVRYLLLQGKMADKRAYIEYKNNILFPLISIKTKQSPIKLQQPDGQYKRIIKECPTRSTVQIPIVIRHCVKQQQE